MGHATQPKHRRGRDPIASAPRVGTSALVRRGVPLLIMLAAAAGAWALFHYVILTRVPRELLGKWVVIEGEQEGVSVHFFRDGTAHFEFNRQGKVGTIKGRAKVDGRTLSITATNPLTQELQTGIQTIQNLTAKELVLEDEKGTLLKMERAVE